MILNNQAHNRETSKNISKMIWGNDLIMTHTHSVLMCDRDSENFYD